MTSLNVLPTSYLVADGADVGAVDDVHEVDDEDVVLERGDAVSRQDRLTAADRTGEGQTLGRDVVGEAALAEGVQTRQDLRTGVAIETQRTAEQLPM